MATVRQIEAGNTQVPVVLTLNAETVILTSPKMAMPVNSDRVYVYAWAQYLSGTTVTDVIVRLRRGVDLSGVLVSGATPEAIFANPTGTAAEPKIVSCLDNPGNVDFVQYTLTLNERGGAVTGQAVQASILVIAL
jgi:hypothetical protein